MGTAIRIAGANFTKFVDQEMPYLALAAGYWLFGGDEASSLLNRAPGATINGTKVGTGAPIYDAAGVRMSMTGANASAFDMGITLSPTHPFTMLVISQPQAGAAYMRQALAGTWHDAVTGSDLFQGGDAGMPSASFSGGAVLTLPASPIAPGQIAMMASTSTATERAVYMHDGVSMKKTTGAAVGAPTPTTFRVGPFGTRSASASDTTRYCAAMLFPLGLTEAQLLELRDFFKWMMSTRGVSVL